MMTKNNKRPRWFFYPAWVAVSAISIPVALAITWALISLVEKVVGGTIQVGGQTRITEDYISTYILIPVLGLLVGFLQYLLLRRHLPQMGWWIAATTLGLLLGIGSDLLLIRDLQSAPDAMWFWILITMLIGASMGLVQWLVLRQRVRHAAWWILANVLGWSIVGWRAATASNQMLIPAMGILLVPGIVTSIALWLLLDQLPRQEGNRMNSPPNASLDPTQ